MALFEMEGNFEIALRHVASAVVSHREKDSLRDAMAEQGKITTRRLFVGTKRGVQNGALFDETGLFICNKYGKNTIKLYVDNQNKPHLEMFDSTGNKLVYELELKKK